MTGQSVAEHLELALKHAEDEETVFHLRQALQLLKASDGEEVLYRRDFPSTTRQPSVLDDSGRAAEPRPEDGPSPGQ